MFGYILYGVKKAMIWRPFLNKVIYSFVSPGHMHLVFQPAWRTLSNECSHAWHAKIK